MPRAGAAGAFRYDLYIMEYILKQINALVPLSPATEDALRSCLAYCHFPKRCLLVESGRRAGSAFFIRRGITLSTLSRLRG